MDDSEHVMDIPEFLFGFNAFQKNGENKRKQNQKRRGGALFSKLLPADKLQRE